MAGLRIAEQMAICSTCPLSDCYGTKHAACPLRQAETEWWRRYYRRKRAAHLASKLQRAQAAWAAYNEAVRIQRANQVQTGGR